VNGYHTAATRPSRHHIGLGNIAEAVFVIISVGLLLLLLLLLLLRCFLESAQICLNDFSRLLEDRGDGATGAFRRDVVDWEVGDRGPTGDC